MQVDLLDGDALAGHPIENGGKPVSAKESAPTRIT
jgi:hypothetical protein